MNKLLAVVALAGAGALVAATAPYSPRAAAAPADNVGSLLQRYDLSSVLRTLPDESGESGGNSAPMNGFFGVSRYRIEVVLSRVQRDAQQPGRYHVWGKDRFKGRVTPFAGTLDFTQAVAQPRRSKQKPTPTEPDYYTATGTYELRENAGPGAGVFKGHVALDLGIDADGEVSQVTRGPGTLTKGGGILYDGTWTSLADGQSKPAVFVTDIFSYDGPQVFANFTVGERDVDFNPKYARLGWNSYWQNDEWWADARPVAKQASPRRKP